MKNFQFNNHSAFSYRTDRSLINKSFLWMSAGLILSAAVSYFMYASGLLLMMLYKMPVMSLILVVLQFGLVIAFTAMMNRASTTTLKILFLAYAATLGVSLSSLAYVYEVGTIFLAFLVSAVYFICLAAIGFTTKLDLSKIGTLCAGALIAMIITQLLLSLFHVSMNQRLICIIGLLIFTGLTAWDMQKLHRMSSLTIDGDAQDRLSIYFALQLYLDFINIFLYVIQLLGNNSKN